MAPKNRAAQAAPSPSPESSSGVVEITHSEAAELARLKRATWVSYVSRGQAPQPLRYVGTTPVFDRAAVMKWIAERPGSGYRRDIHGSTVPGVTDSESERHRAPCEKHASGGQASRPRRAAPKSPRKKPTVATSTVRGRGNAR